MDNNTFHEYTLSTNEVSKPKVLKDDRAIAVLLYRLIMMNPGDNPIYPGMGVGLTTKWRYIVKKDLQNLKKCISEQIDTYLPQFQAVSIVLKINTNNKSLIIDVTIDGSTYTIDTSSTSTPITLSDFK